MPGASICDAKFSNVTSARGLTGVNAKTRVQKIGKAQSDSRSEGLARESNSHSHSRRPSFSQYWGGDRHQANLFTFENGDVDSHRKDDKQSVGLPKHNLLFR
jgi:hypothetical protein